jgi:hypothetical protein
MFLRRPVFLACALALSAALSAVKLSAQANVPAHELPPSRAFELFIPYWTSEVGWQSELQLPFIFTM